MARKTCITCTFIAIGKAAHAGLVITRTPVTIQNTLTKSVTFGDVGWKLPLNCQLSETGGSCSPGCHKTYAYDRVTPREYHAKSSETPPAPIADKPLEPRLPDGVPGSGQTNRPARPPRGHWW